MKNTKTLVENKIKELLPEIMELKKGCRVKLYGEISTLTGETFESNGLFYCIAPSIKGVNSYHQDDDFIQILGRPITLFDCLRALKKEGKIDYLYELSMSWLENDEDDLSKKSDKVYNFLWRILK